MKGPPLTFRQWVGWIALGLVILVVGAAAVWRGDILRAGLDPQIPFQTAEPPAPPDYASPAAWTLLDARIPGSGPAAVFFVPPTTFEGRIGWNAPVRYGPADDYMERIVIPNYAGPFERAGAVSIPRYRQASLYARLTLRDDARDARAFAYADVQAAFDTWLERHPQGPLILAGVEQGAELLERLVRERIVPDPALRDRLVAAYLIDAVVPLDRVTAAVPACIERRQTGCLVGWSQVGEGNEGAAARRLRRALVWDEAGRLIDLDGRPALCVNPVSGRADAVAVPARQHLGATNATGLEWGARPAFIDRLVATQCRDGLLRHTEPKTESFRAVGSWADRRKVRPFNLFYADVEADVQARLDAWRSQSSRGL